MPPFDSLDREQFAVVARTTAAIAAAGTVDAALRALLVGMAELSGADSGGVRLLPAEPAADGCCDLIMWKPPAGLEWRRVENLAGSNTARVLATGQGEYTPDVGAAAEAGDPSAQVAHRLDGILSSAIVPLRAAGSVIGTLHADASRPHAFTEGLLAPLQVLADHAGGAVARARLAEAERLAQEQLVVALRNSGTVAFSFDQEGRIDSMVGDALGLTGWTAEELMGRSVMLLADPADEAERYARLQRRLHGSSDAWQQETMLKHRSGASVPVLLAGGPRFVEGTLYGGSGVVTNLLGIKQVQSELQRVLALKARAEGAVRTGRAIGHELGSPLGTIMGIISLLLNDPRLPADIVEDLRLLGAQADRAGDLLRHFARIARYEEMPTPAGPQLDVRRAAGVAEL
ncbi:MAG: PAS domain S-box protein [Chloroflexota bacterium]